jgi:hypothetical protein
MQGETNPGDALLDSEPDTYVRQLFLLRHSGACHKRASFMYAIQAAAGKRRPAASSIIMAMVIAGYATHEVARHLGTRVSNIGVYLKLFFDVQPYLHNRAWLHSIIFSSGDDEGLSTLAAEDRELLYAAFTQGKTGLTQMLSGSSVLDPAARAQLHAQICTAVTARAHLYLSTLQARGATTGPQDFERFMRIAETARLEATDSLQSREAALRDQLIKLVHAKAVKTPEDPKSVKFSEDYGREHPADSVSGVAA